MLTTPKVPIIDAQVHVAQSACPVPGLPPTDVKLRKIDGEEMVAAMDAVGVDGAVLVSPYSFVGFDASFSVEEQARYPARFAVVKAVNTRDPQIAEDLAAWKRTPGAVAVRVYLNRDIPSDPSDAGLSRTLTAAAQHGLPVNIMAWDRLDELREIVSRHPDTQFVIDHLGLRQPLRLPVLERPFADLPKVLALAKMPHVAIKITGACTLARKPFPFPDIWDPVARIFDAFGIERCLWGTDWTRAEELLSYREGVEAFRMTDRLSDSDRATLMGGALTRLYGWAPQTD